MFKLFTSPSQRAFKLLKVFCYLIICLLNLSIVVRLDSLDLLLNPLERCAYLVIILRYQIANNFFEMTDWWVRVLINSFNLRKKRVNVIFSLFYFKFSRSFCIFYIKHASTKFLKLFALKTLFLYHFLAFLAKKDSLSLIGIRKKGGFSPVMISAEGYLIGFIIFNWVRSYLERCVFSWSLIGLGEEGNFIDGRIECVFKLVRQHNSILQINWLYQSQ